MPETQPTPTPTPTADGQAFDVTLRDVVRVTLPPGTTADTQDGMALLRKKAAEGFAALLAGERPAADFLFAPVS